MLLNRAVIGTPLWIFSCISYKKLASQAKGNEGLKNKDVNPTSYKLKYVCVWERARERERERERAYSGNREIEK